MLANLKIYGLFLLLVATFQPSCRDNGTQTQPTSSENPTTETPIETRTLRMGAERFEEYLGELVDKRVALLVNQTSQIGNRHLVDVLLEKGVRITQIFAPEHGFRGEADRGASVKDGKDTKTGLPITSLYGRKKKASPEDLAGIDVVLFDIQDVGVRFYTYIGSMHYMMEACAENEVDFMVLDRPNPNGHYVDGNILDMEYRSFVGMHPVPIVHGMTVGEYARMLNGEGWLANGVKCPLRVIDCEHYSRQEPYTLPIKPSPNLPNNRSIYLYPSLCFFEGTPLSVGRGTEQQFQVLGHPDLTIGDYYFTPVSMAGASRPVLEGQRSRGFDLTYLEEYDLWEEGKIQLSYLIEAYAHFPNRASFFNKNGFFDTLAGGTELRQQLKAGWSEEEIRESWREGLEQFKTMRKRYLQYP